MKINKRRLGFAWKMVLSFFKTIVLLFIVFMAMVGIYYSAMDLLTEEKQNNNRPVVGICDTTKQIDQLSILYGTNLVLIKDQEGFKEMVIYMEEKLEHTGLSQSYISETNDFIDKLDSAIDKIDQYLSDTNAQISRVKECKLLSDEEINKVKALGDAEKVPDPQTLGI